MARYKEVYGHFKCQCAKCNKIMETHREVVWADLEGEVFKAYYCATCKQEAEKSWCSTEYAQHLIEIAASTANKWR